MDKKKRLKELVVYLNECSYAYYVLDNPKITDTEYDALYYELKDLENEIGIILKNSPTQRVGDIILDKFEKSIHRSKMWSLDKVNSFEELDIWHEKNLKVVRENNLKSLTYIVMKKFDGASINLTYENGEFLKAATRGTGEIGENVSEQVKTIKSIPMVINDTSLFEIRGEVIMTKESFKNYNKKCEVPLKNLRNAASGALRNLDANETKKRNLTSYLFDIGYYEDNKFNSFLHMLEFLKSNNFKCCDFKVCENIDDVKIEITKIGEFRDELEYDIDGIVISINEFDIRDILGYTVKHPKWSIAYKFDAIEETTKLLDIEWNVSRSGRVTPTAILSPIDIGGITIKRATLNNMDDIERKQIKINADVLIRRSNDVIPEIVGSLNNNAKNLIDIIPPSKCPFCNCFLERDGVHIYCSNTISCKPQIVKTIVHYASRDAMNIEGFSEKIATQFYEELNIKRISDLYKVSIDDLLKLDKFKEKKANNILNAIKNSKLCNLENFIYALGIKNIGLKTSKDIVKEYGNLHRILEITREDLQNVHGIGDVIIDEILKFFSKDEVLNEIQEILKMGIEFRESKNEKIESEFSNKTVVVTGSMKKFSRKEIKDLLEVLGARVLESVSKKTDFVIYGENAGSKLTKAQSLNIKTITEKEFNEFCEKLGI